MCGPSIPRSQAGSERPHRRTSGSRASVISGLAAPGSPSPEPLRHIDVAVAPTLDARSQLIHSPDGTGMSCTASSKSGDNSLGKGQPQRAANSRLGKETGAIGGVGVLWGGRT